MAHTCSRGGMCWRKIDDMVGLLYATESNPARLIIVDYRYLGHGMDMSELSSTTEYGSAQSSFPFTSGITRRLILAKFGHLAAISASLPVIKCRVYSVRAIAYDCQVPL
jgi:hypothetical protein